MNRPAQEGSAQSGPSRGVPGESVSGESVSGESVPGESVSGESVWRGPILAWIALIALLGANVGIAVAPLGPAKSTIVLLISIAQIVLVGLVFMRLNRSSNLVRLTALAGFFWLMFLFAMAGADYLTRA